MLSSLVAESLRSYGHFTNLGVQIALSHRRVEKRSFFRVKQIKESTAHTLTVRARPRLIISTRRWPTVVSMLDWTDIGTTVGQRIIVFFWIQSCHIVGKHDISTHFWISVGPAMHHVCCVGSNATPCCWGRNVHSTARVYFLAFSFFHYLNGQFLLFESTIPDMNAIII